MSALFEPLSMRGLRIRNRIFVSPMCQYSCRDGLPTPWHLVHLGSRAVGGAGLVMVEATAVNPEGRISPDDCGLWDDRQAGAFAPIARFIREQGAVPAIQIAHAGRKASTDLPWKGGAPLGPQHRGWQPVAPSALPYASGHVVPKELAVDEISNVVGDFASAAGRARAAGFDVVEIHMAHGYLIHEFLSPLANRRADEYGGPLENRLRFPLQVAAAVREVWPAQLPVFARISVTDWTDGGWDLAQSLELCRRLREAGVDFVDCSAAGVAHVEGVPFGPGYLTPFSASIRKEVGIATGVVGFITAPAQAEQIVATGQADAVSLAREMLRDPYWPLHAARALGVEPPWPAQYERART